MLALQIVNLSNMLVISCFVGDLCSMSALEMNKLVLFNSYLLS